MTLNQFLYNETFPDLVVLISHKLYLYQTVYEKVKFECLVFLKCTFLNVESRCTESYQESLPGESINPRHQGCRCPRFGHSGVVLACFY